MCREIIGGLYQIKAKKPGSHAYLIKGKDLNILVDSGVHQHMAELEERQALQLGTSKTIKYEFGICYLVVKMLLKLPDAGKPEVGEGTYIAEGAAVIGNVRIGKRVFVAPTAVIRADEENSSILIEDECNVQDGVIIHALENTQVVVGEGTSLAHGCIVHGPCSIGRECFVGFRATVFKSTIGEGSVVMHGAMVLNVSIPPGKLVPPGALVDSQEAVERLQDVSADLKEFKSSVRRTNVELTERYTRATYSSP
jgi:carbonic anhydrase/acetyltransferase-like protein (isoleucine patch superfamily)